MKIQYIDVMHGARFFHLCLQNTRGEDVKQIYPRVRFSPHAQGYVCIDLAYEITLTVDVEYLEKLKEVLNTYEI